MRPILVSIFVFIIAGVWLHPLFTNRTNRSDASQSLAPTPSTLPLQWETLRGKQGFWRLGKTPEGIWWFISPTGKADFLNTVTTVQPYQVARNPFGPDFISKDYDGGTGDGGDLRAWARATLQRVRNTGFKGFGAWCHPIFHEYDLPFTRDLNMWAWVPPEHRRLYSPKWAEFIEQAASHQIPPIKENPNLVGYYTDNELDWGDGESGPGTYFNHLPADDPNRAQVIAVIQKTWPDIARFNEVWQSNIQSWDELTAWKTIPHDIPGAYTQLYRAWLEHLARDYFRITSEIVRKYDSNHLILGVRFKGYAPKEVVRGSKEYTDAQSLNYYVGDAKLDSEMFSMMNEETGQPVIISEYSFHSLDGRSGNRNTVGFSAQVLDQEARADGYRIMTQRLAKIPYVVGADWFQWADEPPSGRKQDGEDVNFGVVDIDDNPYALLTRAVQATAPTLNLLHSASVKENDPEVWRDPFRTSSTTSIPYLVRKPILNGELSDWPAASKLHNVRLAQTIGLERSRIPLPGVYLGWREDGLYVAFEAYDHDIRGAAPQGWWWTRDCIEFWIATRPVHPDQEIYDTNCHQFFFVPVDSGDSIGGVVGQWHRSGDALSDNLIPHPKIRQVSRILHDRYVVEIFIPTEALNGFDPKGESKQIAFNMHVKNFQHATDYFWSAPKEVMTQLRPNTWGAVELMPKPEVAVK